MLVGSWLEGMVHGALCGLGIGRLGDDWRGVWGTWARFWCGRVGGWGGVGGGGCFGREMEESGILAVWMYEFPVEKISIG